MIRIAPMVLMALAASAHAQSTIYKCTDAAGGTLISNTRVDKSCKAVVTGPENAMKAPRAPSAAATPTPASFPKVADDQQKARDTDRKRILEQELAGEQKNLEQAKRELADQESSKPNNEDKQRGMDRMQPYRDRVAQHERNIVAINRELSAMK